MNQLQSHCLILVFLFFIYNILRFRGYFSKGHKKVIYSVTVFNLMTIFAKPKCTVYKKSWNHFKTGIVKWVCLFIMNDKIRTPPFHDRKKKTKTFKRRRKRFCSQKRQNTWINYLPQWWVELVIYLLTDSNATRYMKVKRMGITENLRRICLFSANKIKSFKYSSKQPAQLIVKLSSSLQHIIVTKKLTGKERRPANSRYSIHQDSEQKLDYLQDWESSSSSPSPTMISPSWPNFRFRTVATSAF